VPHLKRFAHDFSVIAARTDEKGRKAVENLRRETGNYRIDYILLELSSFNSIQNFVQEFKKRGQHINFLINNAGVLVNILIYFSLKNSLKLLLTLKICKSEKIAKFFFTGSSVHYNGRRIRTSIRSQLHGSFLIDQSPIAREFVG
jgi:NAD(P)-dependent dehydrogenase (short-subunit alcohol dehydrogenase family)